MAFCGSTLGVVDGATLVQYLVLWLVKGGRGLSVSPCAFLSKSDTFYSVVHICHVKEKELYEQQDLITHSLRAIFCSCLDR